MIVSARRRRPSPYGASMRRPVSVMTGPATSAQTARRYQGTPSPSQAVRPEDLVGGGELEQRQPVVRDDGHRVVGSGRSGRFGTHHDNDATSAAGSDRAG